MATSLATRPLPIPPRGTGVIDLADDDDDEDVDDERSDDEDDDAGSLVDFVVDGEEEEEDDDDDAASVESEGPQTKEEALKRDMDGMDASNIVTGKRVRRSTKFYEREVFATPEYRRMMLCDVPAEEMHAVEASDDDEEEEDDDESGEEDGEYEDEEEDEEEEDDDEATTPASPPSPPPRKTHRAKPTKT